MFLNKRMRWIFSPEITNNNKNNRLNLEKQNWYSSGTQSLKRVPIMSSGRKSSSWQQGIKSAEGVGSLRAGGCGPALSSDSLAILYSLSSFLPHIWGKKKKITSQNSSSSQNYSITWWYLNCSRIIVLYPITSSLNECKKETIVLSGRPYKPWICYCCYFLRNSKTALELLASG